MRILSLCLLTLWAGAVGSSEPSPRVAQTNKPQLIGGSSHTDRSVTIEKMGNPLAPRYPDGSPFHFARTISDLQAFDGKLYIGHGDIVLYLPGMDPREDWSLGNFYRLEDGR